MSPRQLFFRRSSHERLLFLEAFAGLCWEKTRVHVLPFRRLAPGLGTPQRETAPTICAAQRAVAVEVSWAVQAAARHSPIRFVCLPQALAARRMLRRRRIASTLYLGVALDAEKSTLLAHAWLRAGDKILTGEAEAAHHRQLVAFASDGIS